MDTFSFTKTDRLINRKNFIYLQKAGKKIQNRYFLALYSPGEKDRSRIGFTISKRVGSAVIRNRIKRISRECFRLSRHRIEGVWDINIIAKKDAVTLSSDQAFSALQNLFGRIGP